MAKPRTSGFDEDRRSARQAEPALRAGEVDDHRLFSKYLKYAREYTAGGGVREFDASERYRVVVRDPSGRPVPDVPIRVASAGQNIFSARTGADGAVAFFPTAIEALGASVPSSLTVSAGSGNQAATRTVERTSEGGDWNLELASTAGGRLTLDLLFLIDTTGSMSEEISRVRDTVHAVSSRIKALPSRPELRLGMVLYRDRGDEYVTRRRPFTSDVDQFHAALKDVRADGGGDEPEHLNAGLQQAIEAMDWSPSQAVRMMFVIADAPPHLDYEDEYDYFLGAVRAAEKGIKIFGVSTVGTNDVGEYVFRQLSLLTRGRFVFVTRGDANGGESTPHHVDRQDFTVQRLDDLIVRLVTEELAPLATRIDRQQ